MTAIDTLRKIKQRYDKPGAWEKLALVRMTQVYMMAMLAMFPVSNVPIYTRYLWTPENMSISPMWSCSKCGEFIASGVNGVGCPVGVHECRHGFTFPRSMAVEDGLITDSNTCLLCGQFWSNHASHTCNHPFLNSFGYDLTDVLSVAGQIIKGIGVTQALLKLFRTTPLNIVVVNREFVAGRWVLTRFHGYISQSTMMNAGWGLFSTFQIPFGATLGAFDGFSPILGGKHVVPFTGELVEKVPERDIDLACHVMKDESGEVKKVINPTRLGGVAVLTNCKHRNPPCEAFDYPDRMVIILKRSIGAHEEVCWNYEAITDNPEEAKIRCSCGCRGHLLKLVNDVHHA
jgi:hypothetical protein